MRALPSFCTLALLTAPAIAAPQISDPAAALQPVSLADAVAEFKAICADTKSDPAGVAAARAASAWGYQISRESPAMMRQPGNRWESAKAIHGYASADWLPLDLPSPQCSLEVALTPLAGDTPKAKIEQAITQVGSALGLGKPTIEGGGPEQRASWTVGAKGEVRSRFFMTIELMGDEPAGLSLHLLRIRK